MTGAPMFGMKLYGLEILHVIWIEKHVSDGGCSPMHFVGMTGQDDTFRDNAGSVWIIISNLEPQRSPAATRRVDCQKLLVHRR